ncbi:5'-AMP-activated protein kinase subunit gamma [Fusarium oxysporum f. sp. albedinis]|nr:5'-AMP-activated protein kinase subunit gamma [Fusarium oxysporum f. sp. albedinis]KAK2469216.1 hypothetical protein H9L39_19197 [Fusarium oxysporum f. sp. albedinis]
MFEEARKVLSAEYLRRSLGLAWPQLYSVAQSPSQIHYPFTSTDSPTQSASCSVLPAQQEKSSGAFNHPSTGRDTAKPNQVSTNAATSLSAALTWY